MSDVLERIAETLMRQIEAGISVKSGTGSSDFLLTQEQSIEVLRTVARRCNDRADGIQEEIDQWRR